MIKIKEKQIVIITIVGLLTVLLTIQLLIIIFEREREYTIADMFADSSANRKIVFAFIEVEEYDKARMLKFGKNFKQEQIESFVDESGKSLVVIAAHFYNLKDTMPLTPELMGEIEKNYPNLKNAEINLQFVKKGYIYRGLSHKVEGSKMPLDTIFATTVIIPRKGVSARYLMKGQK